MEPKLIKSLVYTYFARAKFLRSVLPVLYFLAYSKSVHVYNALQVVHDDDGG